MSNSNSNSNSNTNKEQEQSEKELDNLVDDFPEQQVVENGRMLHTVFSQFLEYHDTEGSSLNLCEVLLLLKDSIDQNTKIQQDILKKMR